MREYAKGVKNHAKMPIPNFQLEAQTMGNVLTPAQSDHLLRKIQGRLSAPAQRRVDGSMTVRARGRRNASIQRAIEILLTRMGAKPEQFYAFTSGAKLTFHTLGYMSAAKPLAPHVQRVLDAFGSLTKMPYSHTGEEEWKLKRVDIVKMIDCYLTRQAPFDDPVYDKQPEKEKTHYGTGRTLTAPDARRRLTALCDKYELTALLENPVQRRSKLRVENAQNERLKKLITLMFMVFGHNPAMPGTEIRIGDVLVTAKGDALDLKEKVISFTPGTRKVGAQFADSMVQYSVNPVCNATDSKYITTEGRLIQAARDYSARNAPFDDAKFNQILALDIPFDHWNNGESTAPKKEYRRRK